MRAKTELLFLKRGYQVTNAEKTALENGLGFPGGSEGKDSTCNAGDLGSIPRSGRSPEEENGNPLQ